MIYAITKKKNKKANIEESTTEKVPSSPNSNNYYIKNLNLNYYNSHYSSKEKENTLTALSIVSIYIY